MAHAHEILNHVAPALLVICRVSGLMIFGPVLGAAMIPMRVKVFLAISLGAAVYLPLSDAGHIQLEGGVELWTLTGMVVAEFFIGMVIGYAASLPLIAMQTGGLVMGQQMGLGFAQFFNPGLEDEADVLGQMLFFMAIAGFLLIGGLEWMAMAVIHSFEHVQVGEVVSTTDVVAVLVGLLQSMFELALRVAAPLLAIIFLETVAVGFLAKTVPQLNILTLGFPLRILVGLLIVAAGLTVINDVAVDGLSETMNTVMAWIESTPASE